VSLGFDRWDESSVTGPSLYVVVVAGVNVDEYADPLGGNRWPVERCRVVDEDVGAFAEAARDGGHDQDGAIVGSADGTVHGQIVRVRSLAADDGGPDRHVQRADWMGTEHLSAAEASLRGEVVATITLGEEDGRVTRLENGRVGDRPRSVLGGP
jgi:hypothetical protein